MPGAAANDSGRGFDMFLKNEAARLITINHLVGDKETSYPILPGENPAVEVPDAAAKIDFVKALLKNGDLRRVGADELAQRRRRRGQRKQREPPRERWPRRRKCQQDLGQGTPIGRNRQG